MEVQVHLSTLNGVYFQINSKKMKKTSTFLLLLTYSLVYSQNCDYNFSSSIVLYPNDYILTIDREDGLIKKIEGYKACILNSTDHNELFWLHNAIAINLNTLNAPADSISHYAKIAFDYD